MDNDYYNFMNLQEYLEKKNIKGMTMRYAKEIVDISCSQFKYKNLPDKLTSQIIENSLMFNNHLCFYKSSALNEIVLCRYIPNGKFDIYWKPTKVQLLAMNGELIANNVNYEDIILCRDNILDITPFIVLDEYCQRMKNIENTLDVNISWLKFPRILECDRKQLSGIKTMFSSIKNFEPYVVTNQGALDGLKSIPFDVPVQPMDIYDLYVKYKNMCLSSMGIYSSDQKHERMIVSEAVQQNDYVDFTYNEKKQERLLFIKQLNEKYGTNIELEESYIQFKKEDINLNNDGEKDIINYEYKKEIELEKVKNEGVENNGE